MRVRMSNTQTIGSIFETFKIGVGPSSSHSMGPALAARHFATRQTGQPARVRVTLYGSLAATGRGHLTDLAIAGALAPAPCEFIWDTTTPTLRHPNTMKFEALDAQGRLLAEWTAYSVGGGNVADEQGSVSTGAGIQYPIRSIADAIALCQTEKLALWQLVERMETDLWPRLQMIWRAMRESVDRGLNSRQILLPGALELARRAPATALRARHLETPQRDLALISAYALAVAEENANGSAVVTAPTCGSAGIVPGLLYYFATVKQTPESVLLRALATAGLFGSVIRANASISGAEAGCEAEVGAACSMAAAAGAQILDGSLHQIEYAAEIAMEHHLGLTCDPIEGYVQIPCIERNLAGCLRAFECATFAVLTDGRHLVSFDDVIEVMRRTGHDLQSAYRETARGGLALLWKRHLRRTGFEGSIFEPVPHQSTHPDTTEPQKSAIPG